METIKISIHPKLRVLPKDKQEKNELNSKVAYGWKAVEYDLEQLHQHIKSGGGIGAIYNNGHRSKSNFISSQIICLDFDDNVDIADVLVNEFVAEHECFVGNTISHTEESPRTRVYFPLDKTINATEKFEQLANKVLFAVDELNPDATSNQGERFFHGVRDVVYHPGKPLTIDDIESLPEPPTTNDKSEFVERPDFDFSVYGDSENTRLEYIKNLKDDRNYSGCYIPSKLFSREGKYSDDEIEQMVFAANVGNGYVAKHGKEQALASIRSGIRNGKAAKTKLPQISEIKTDLTINKQYLEVSDIQPFLDAGKHVVIKSEMGTGKTEVISKIIEGKSVVSSYHRITLSEDTANRYKVMNYRDENGVIRSDKEIREAERLNIVVNSIPKVSSIFSGVPQRDLFIADEVDQNISQIFSDTLEANQTEAVYTTTCALIANSTNGIYSSAHISNLEIDFVKSIVGDENVVVIVNEYQKPKKAIYQYKHKNTLIREIRTRISKGETPIGLACSSIEESKYCAKYFRGLFGEDSVCLMNKETKDSDKRDFIKNKESVVSSHKLIIYTQTLGSGVDIQTHMKAVFGIFNANPIIATECHQMLNRFRNVDETHVFVDPTKQNLNTNWEFIYESYLNSAEGQNKTIGSYNNKWEYEITERQKEMLKLQAKLEANRNQQLNDLSGYFKAYATGYSKWHWVDESDETTQEEINVTIEQNKSEQKEKVLNADAVDNETFKNLQEKGLVTDSIREGNRRYKIERCSGEVISSEVYDLLHDRKEQNKVYLFKDFLYATNNELLQRDQYEMTGNLTRLNHNFDKVNLLKELINRVFGALDSSIHVDEAVIETRMVEYMNLVGEKINSIFPRETDSDNSVTLLRWLLKQIGLKLKTKREQIGKVKHNVYHLDSKQLDLMKRFAEQNYKREMDDRKSSTSLSDETYWLGVKERIENNKIANLPISIKDVEGEFATLPKTSAKPSLTRKVSESDLVAF